MGLLFRSLFEGLSELLMFLAMTLWVLLIGVDVDVGVTGEKKLFIDLADGLLGVWLKRADDFLTGMLQSVVDLWAIT